MTGDEKARGVDLADLAVLLSNPNLKADGALHNVRAGPASNSVEAVRPSCFRPWPGFLESLVPTRIPCTWSLPALSFGPPSIRAKAKLIALVSRIGSPEVRNAKKKVTQPSETEVQDRNS